MQDNMLRTNPKLMSAMNAIQAKLEKISDLEKNVMHLSEMIGNLSLIVVAQNELITSIEQNVLSIKNYLESGLKNFNKAKDSYLTW